jgi:hypothetical protein
MRAREIQSQSSGDRNLNAVSIRRTQLLMNGFPRQGRSRPLYHASGVLNQPLRVRRTQHWENDPFHCLLRYVLRIMRAFGAQICGPLLCNGNRDTSGQSEDKSVLHLHLLTYVKSPRESHCFNYCCLGGTTTARGCVICVDRQGQSHYTNILSER